MSARDDIEIAVIEHIAAAAGAWYDERFPPTLEILAETDDGIDFIAEHFNYKAAQSGSDSADHRILRGHANADGSNIVFQPFYVQLTESENDDYDNEQIYALVRAGDIKAARVAVARMKLAGPDRRRANDPKALAELAEEQARKPHVRCPRCASTDARVVDVSGYSDVRMQCFACGFGDYVNRYQDQWA